MNTDGWITAVLIEGKGEFVRRNKSIPKRILGRWRVRSRDFYVQVRVYSVNRTLNEVKKTISTARESNATEWELY